MTVEPFRIWVSDNVLNDLRTRLARTRFTDPFRGSRRPPNGGNARWRHGKAVTSRLRCQPPESVAAAPRV